MRKAYSDKMHQVIMQGGADARVQHARRTGGRTINTTSAVVHEQCLRSGEPCVNFAFDGRGARAGPLDFLYPFEAGTTVLALGQNDDDEYELWAGRFERRISKGRQRGSIRVSWLESAWSADERAGTSDAVWLSRGTKTFGVVDAHHFVLAWPATGAGAPRATPSTSADFRALMTCFLLVALEDMAIPGVTMASAGVARLPRSLMDRALPRFMNGPQWRATAHPRPLPPVPTPAPAAFTTSTASTAPSTPTAPATPATPATPPAPTAPAAPSDAKSRDPCTTSVTSPDDDALARCSDGDGASAGLAEGSRAIEESPGNVEATEEKDNGARYSMGVGRAIGADRVDHGDAEEEKKEVEPDEGEPGVKIEEDEDEVAEPDREEPSVKFEEEGDEVAAEPDGEEPIVKIEEDDDDAAPMDEGHDVAHLLVQMKSGRA